MTTGPQISRGAYSRAERDDEFLEAYSGYGYDGPANESTLPGTNVGFRESGNGELLLYPSQGLDGSNIVLTDPQGWGSGSNLVQAGFINEPHTEDHIGRLKLSATRYFESGPFSDLEFGADYEHRRKDYVISQEFLVLGGGPSLLLNGGATQTRRFQRARSRGPAIRSASWGSAQSRCTTRSP